jgi:hypothetical protein
VVAFGPEDELRSAIVAVVLTIAALAATGASAANVVGEAVQKLHLSPQQLLSLRDTLGNFGRGAAVEASGENLFVLRDTATMAYAGEFALRELPDSSLELDRVSGPATLDSANTLLISLRLNAKSRAQVLGVLANSQVAAQTGLPEPSLPAISLTGANAAGSLMATRAVFFADGSGWVRTLRAPALPAGTAPVPMRLADRYVPAIRSDGARAWRDSAVEIDSDVQLRLADLDTRTRCAPGTLCHPHGPAASPSAIHFIRWGPQTIAAVPPSLLAQLAPQPPVVIAPTVPEETLPAPGPQIVTPPAPAEAAPAVPENSAPH